MMTRFLIFFDNLDAALESYGLSKGARADIVTAVREAVVESYVLGKEQGRKEAKKKKMKRRKLP